MATNIGPKIGIDGEAEYRQQLKEIIQTQKTLKAEMKAMSSAWDKDSNSLKKNRETREQLTKMIDNQKAKVDKLKEGLAQSEKATGENSIETERWKQRVAEAQAELNKLNKELKDTPNQMQVLGSAMQSAGDKIKGTGEKFMPFSAAAAAGLGASAKAALDFEDAMAKVSTIADTSEVPLDDLRKAIMDLSTESGIAAPEIANNVYDAISAGQKTGDAVNFVKNATDLARAGFTSSASALDILTTTLNAYGMSAEDVTRVSDVLITTQNLGKTTVDQLASSMGKVIPTAKANGVEFESLAAAYAVMTANGIATAETTTYLNSMLNELGKGGTKAEQSFRKGTEGIKEGGLSMKEAIESGMSLTDILLVLDGQAQASGTSISNLFGSAEAGKAATVLVDNATKLDETIAAMGTSAGATSTAYEKLNTTTFEAQKSVNELKNSGIELGNALLTTLSPAIEGVSGAISSATTWFNGLSDSQKQMIAAVGLGVAAFGPFLVILGTLITSAGTVVSAIGAVGAVLTGPVVAGFGAALGAAFPFIAVGGAVAAAAYTIYQNWDLIKAKAGELATTAKQKFEDFKKAATDKFNAAKTAVEGAMNNIKTAVDNKLNNIKTATDEKLGFVKKTWEESGGGIQGAAETAMTVAQKAFDDAYNAIDEATGGKLSAVVGTVTGIMDNIKKAFDEKMELAKKIVQDGIDFIKGIFDFDWKLPDLKLPHFSVSGEFSLNPPSIPHFNVEWYAKAMQGGVILNHPTIFGAQGNNLLGAGEVGPEVVVGANSLYSMIQGAVSSAGVSYGGVNINIYPGAGQDAKEIAREVADILNGDLERERAVWA